jgi:hypothetical protein
MLKGIYTFTTEFITGERQETNEVRKKSMKSPKGLEF